MANQDAAQDPNQFPAMIAHSGTAGTSETVRVTSQNTAGAVDVHVVGGTTVTTIALNSGTLNTLGTVGTIQSGTITRIQTIGTLEVGTISALPNTPGGTLGLVTRVGSVGTVEVATISALPNIPGGTIGSVSGVGVLTSLSAGTITKLEGGTLGILSQGSINVTAGTVIVTNGTIGAGTIAVSEGTIGGKAASGAVAVANPVSIAGTDSGGTIYGLLVDTKGQQFISAGTITRLEQGSINVTAGTIASVGTVPGVGVVTSVTNLAGGTLGILTNGTLSSSGTTTGVGVVTTVTSVTEVANLAKGTVTRLEQGSINVTAGTITAGSIIVTAGTVAAGSIVVTNGTISHGTIDAGTVRVNSIPTVHTQTFGTTTTGTIGTLVGAPSAGSAILIDSLDVNLQNGTAEVLVSYGLVATGNGVVTRGNYVAGGGISKNPTNSIGGSTTGSALTYNILSGSGTVSYSLAYKIAVP